MDPDMRVFAMNRVRMTILYSGRVQGVGFRYGTRTVAHGFEVTGTVRNLPDGRVELVVEGTREELESFRSAIREAGLGGFIHQEQVLWGSATGSHRGFVIVG
jgi:acylphosphatase